ncbi:hypothetical protein IU431_33530 [Nocardia otitidiscaviarum]|uniref:hypothetical protein n=1 Tax=Nocardia otitidiscaviarum TaxID=1823 RepID=UPI0004A75BD8|nr:hypothetical protein [Nocardia otitidiscaviarum]MBF6489044.1 hypothetical protein [Nocardia otitidiscaviarum]
MRADLLALTDDSLISLANRGLLKRAVKENAAAPPELTESGDGTVAVTFADGVRTTLPPDTTLELSSCTCAATTVCRHRVRAVLAYRAYAETSEPAAESARADSPEAAVSWSPAEFTDEQLRDLVGARAFAAAGRARRAGYRARVRRATAHDPVPSAELSAVTVRFLVPGDLGYARTDAARGARADAIVLAVWAFRAADAVDTVDETVEVTVGDHADGTAAGAAAGAAAAVLTPLAELLEDGVAQACPALPQVFAGAHRALDAAGARWPHDALTELLDQLAAYRDRAARHDPLRTAALIAELVARQRAGTRDPVAVLGTEEAARTPLRHLRLTGLGARVHGDDESRCVEVYLAHPEARIVLTLRHTIAVREGAVPPTAAALGARRAGTSRLRELAAGHIVTESAVRSANRGVRLATGRVARTSVLPATGDWDTLPPELLVTDLDAEAARLAALPPTVIRPRVRGEAVRAVAVERIDAIHYLPDEQRLEATVHAPAGRATVTFTHTAAAPGALDDLARTLSGDAGPIRFLAGTLERHHGRLTLDPTAVVAAAAVVVPAFATTDHPTPSGAAAPQPDPLAAALTTALALSAELPHRGLRHLPPTWSARAADTAATLRRLGLPGAAASLDRLCRTLTHPGPAALDHWADTHLRLLVTAERL